MKKHWANRLAGYTAILYLGDLAMILLFTRYGSSVHHLGLSFASNLATALPFLLSWTVCGYIIGAFRAKAWSGYGAVAAYTAAAWVPGLLVGLVLRLLMYGKPMFTMFGLLALPIIYLFLLAWRLLFVLITKRTAA